MDATHEPPALAAEVLDALPFPAFLVDERRRVICANASSKTAFGDLGDGRESLCRRLGHDGGLAEAADDQIFISDVDDRIESGASPPATPPPHGDA